MVLTPTHESWWLLMKRNLQVEADPTDEMFSVIVTKALLILLEKNATPRVKVIVLIFLQEHSRRLFANMDRLSKFMRTAEHILENSSGDGISSKFSAIQDDNSLVQGQLLITMTTVLLEIDAYEKHRALFNGFLNLLCHIAFATESHLYSSNSFIRQTVCESLRELELTYPCILSCLLGKLISEEKLESQDVIDHNLPESSNSDIPFQWGGDAKRITNSATYSSPLLHACKTERSHASHSYTVLFATVLEHMCTKMVSSDNPLKNNSSHDPFQFQWHYPRSMYASALDIRDATNDSILAQSVTTDKSNSKLALYDIERVVPIIGFILDNIMFLSTWGRTSLITKIVPFAEMAGLSKEVLSHHLLPFIFNRNPLIVHTILLLHAALPGVFSSESELILCQRLIVLTQEHTMMIQLRIICLQWLLAFPALPIKQSQDVQYANRYSSIFRLLHLHHRQIVPRALDPIHLISAKQRTLLYCFHRDPRHPCAASPSILSTLDCLKEFYWHTTDSRFTHATYSFLFLMLCRFPHLCRHITKFMIDAALARPQFVACALDLVKRYETLRFTTKAAKEQQNAIVTHIMRSLSDLLKYVQPVEQLRRYFNLMKRVAGEPLVAPHGTLSALSRFLRGTSACWIGNWNNGTKILDICRTLMSIHPNELIFDQIASLLRFISLYFHDVEVRDCARSYLLLLTHVPFTTRNHILTSEASYNSIKEYENDITMINTEQNNIKMLFAPPNLEVGQVLSLDTLHFLTLNRSTTQRQSTGLQDGGTSYNSQYSRELNADIVHKHASVGDNRSEIGNIPETAALYQQYRKALMDGAVPQKINLPYCISHIGGADGIVKGKCTGNIDQSNIIADISCIYAIVLEVSPSSEYLPIMPLRLPYLCSKNKSGGNENTSNESIDNTTNLSFPNMYKVVFTLQPLAPVPTTFDVRVIFTDSNGLCCEGGLQHVVVQFQDLFLPVPTFVVMHKQTNIEVSKNAREIISQSLFTSLWESIGQGKDPTEADEQNEILPQRGLAGSCSSVKFIPVHRSRILQFIKERLAPFVVWGPLKSKPVFNKEGINVHNKNDSEFIDEEEEWYVDIYKSNISSKENIDKENSCESNQQPKNEKYALQCKVLIFLPPKFHLLFKFVISEHSTIVRIRTDSWQLLSYCDNFFEPWKS